jgi:hypothetical protein
MHVDEQGPVVLVGTGWRKPKPDDATTDIIRGADVARAPALAARVALRWMRQAPEVWGSSPWARAKAVRYAAAHPFAIDAP